MQISARGQRHNDRPSTAFVVDKRNSKFELFSSLLQIILKIVVFVYFCNSFLEAVIGWLMRRFIRVAIAFDSSVGVISWTCELMLQFESLFVMQLEDSASPKR
jgi:hypothetical protein